MKQITLAELNTLLLERGEGRVNLTGYLLKDMDLSGRDLASVDFSDSNFENIDLTDADLSGSILRHVMFTPGCSLRGAKLIDADISGSIFRYCDMSGTDMRGANLFCSNFEHADMSDITANEKTRYYYMRCPEKGPFLGYKRCFNDSLVQLLIPADAKRVSATTDACRCSKAKVLTIKSFDYRIRLQEAWSVVDEDFVYRVGEYVSVPDFNEDRWTESTTGIHFWMTREEAYSYLE